MALVKAISRTHAKDFGGKAIGWKTQPLLIFVVGPYIQPRQNVIVDTRADREDIVGKICDWPDLRIS